MADNVKIRFDNVCREFHMKEGTLRVLDKVNLEIQEGEFVAIVGPSGSGKTTLLNILAGFLDASSGAAYLDDKKVKGPGPERGVIFQQYAVFPWLTVKENIIFGLTLKANHLSRKERDQIAKRYIKLMGLEGFENAYPKTLSGGMKQRVAIARAYAVSPDILLMDEPFAALDAQTRDQMQEQLLQILETERKTVVFITHSVEEAVFLSGRVIVMSARPASVKEIIEVPFEYPRERRIKTQPDFLKVREEIEALIFQEYQKTKGESINFA